MQIIEGVIVPDEIFDVMFACDTDRCHGACCVEGDAGAPLLPEEIGELEENWENAIPWMLSKGIETIKQHGVFDYDEMGNFVTPLVEGRECAFVFYEGQTAKCALEAAYFAGKSSFRKPQSCHLYPIRVGHLPAGDSLFYHKWHICKPALKNGKNIPIRLYEFLREPLIRGYGEEWYTKLEAVAKARNRDHHP